MGGEMEESTRTDELRLALVLNGGVSLAVWMGGVAHELNRLAAEADPVYRALLELTGTVARIDVISGTSAGGINGAALALAQIHGSSLAGLRDVWLHEGGLERLLHDPDQEQLSGLLKGDEHLLPALRRAFKALTSTTPAPPEAVPVDLSLTATLLDGVREESLDDFGAEIEDKVHRAVWRFAHLPGEADDFLEVARVTEQLAFAARASASFPVAFPPALYDPSDALFRDTPARLRARTAEQAPLSGPSFLVDGGVLDNKPFQAALEAIARLPAHGNTRRVLAYVVPDPAEQVEQRKPVAGVLQTPALAEVAWRSLVSIPGTQSIAAHMAELRRHNDEAARRWKRLIGAVVHMGDRHLLRAAKGSMDAYRARRVDGIVQHFLDETQKGLARLQVGSDVQQREAAKGMRRGTRQWLASTWRATAQPVVTNARRVGLQMPAQSVGRDLLATLEQRWRDRIPADFDPRRTVLGEDWGIYPLDFMAQLTIEVLRRTQRLHALVPRWQRERRNGTSADKPVVRGPPRPEQVAAAVAPAPHGGQGRHQSHGPGARLSEDSTRLSGLWQSAYALAAEIRERRRRVNERVRQRGAEGFVAFVQSWAQGAAAGQQPPMDKALGLLDTLLQTTPTLEPTESSQAALARGLFELLGALEPFMREIEAEHQGRGSGRADIDEAVHELRAIARYLFPPGAGADFQTRLNGIAWRVLALEVFEVTACSRSDAPGVQAEVVQISGRLASAFGGSDDPACKLNGMQLAHFGAFYKRSWRANDWTFGRLDGIDRAVRITLNPDALQKRYGNRMVEHGDAEPAPASQYVLDFVHALAVRTADQDMQKVLQPLWDKDLDALRRELAWLDHAQTVAPPVLEHCAAAITRRLQLQALREEIPTIAWSLRTEAASGAPPSAEVGAGFLAQAAPGEAPPALASAEVAVALVKTNLLGSESLKQQLGTDLMTRTAGQALATAHAALAMDGKLTALKVLFRITSWPIRIFYWLASRLSQPGSTAAALEAMAYGIGLTIIIAAGLSEKMPQTVLVFGWALLGGAIATSLLRDKRVGWVLLGAALAALIWNSRGALTAALVVLAVYGLLRWSGGSAFAAFLGIGLAAWWSAGASGPAVAMLLHQVTGWPAIEPFSDAAACQQVVDAADRLWLVAQPALLIGLLMVMVGTLVPLARAKQRLRMEHAGALVGCALVALAAFAAYALRSDFRCGQAPGEAAAALQLPSASFAGPGISLSARGVSSRP